MRKFVIGRNIDHYRRLLSSETNEAKRRTLERLLSEEEQERARLAPDEESDKARKFDG